MKKHLIRRFFGQLRKYILTGVLTILPFYLTVIIVIWVLNVIDRNVLPFIPGDYSGSIYGSGVLILAIFFMLVGFLIANRWGGWIINTTDELLKKIPLLGELYASLKDILRKFLSGDSTAAFSAAVLIEYPTKGAWSMGFITSKTSGEMERKLGKGFVTVFVPLVPVPTSGTFLILNEKRIKRLDMKVQDAFSYMVSLGVVQKNKPSTAALTLEKKVVRQLTHLAHIHDHKKSKKKTKGKKKVKK